MVVSSSNRLIDVVNSIIMDIIFSEDENRELTDEGKRLIRLGLEGASLEEILRALFEFERLNLSRIAWQVLNDNKDIISERTKYADARMGDIGVMIYFLSQYLDGFSEKVSMDIKDIIQRKLDSDCVDEVIIFLKSMYSADMHEKITELISDRLTRRIRNMSLSELIKLLFWMPKYAFERVLDLAKDLIRKRFSSMAPEQIRIFLLALGIKNRTKLDIFLEHMGDIAYLAGFKDSEVAKLLRTKKEIGKAPINLIVIFHSSIEQQDREMVISTVKETSKVNIKTEELPSIVESVIDSFNIKGIYQGHYIVDTLSVSYDDIFLFVAPYKLLAEEVFIEEDFYNPTFEGGEGICGIGAIVSIPSEKATDKKVYIYNVVKHELGHVFGLEYHCEDDCVMGEPQDKPMRFCSKCQKILKKKGILKKP